mmetsp:Transcript_38583/g.62246  ORF Transcript_38583/g.62246 Transcript_38583/m.62246 type:complete len:249 (+) Transcript_38583:1766-2512(+)
MQVGPFARAVAMHRELLALGDHHNHLGNELLRELPGPVHIVATSDDHWEAVGVGIGPDEHLSPGLGGCIGVRRIQHGHVFLLQIVCAVVAGVLTVDLIGADVDEALDLLFVSSGNFQHHVCAEDVCLGEGDGIPKGQVHMGLGCKMHDRVDLLCFHDEVEQVDGSNVSLDELEIRLALHFGEVLQARAGFQAVQDHDLVLGVLLEQQLRHMAGDEACPSCDEQVERLMLRHCHTYRHTYPGSVGGALR